MPRPYGQGDDSGNNKVDYSIGVEPIKIGTVEDEGYSGEALEDDAHEEEAEAETKPESPIAGKMSGSMEQLEKLQAESTVGGEVRECLEDCIDCCKTCTETVTKCLTMGGEHAKLEHLNLLIDCAKICSANADFILRNSTYYPQTCGITADICDECGDTCDRFDDDFMKECANVCRRCSESCREIAR